MKIIDLSPPWRRALLVLPVALALFCALMTARWCIGNTIAEYPPDLETARSAARLAPDDPHTHFTLGRFKQRSFLPEDMIEALGHFERAAALSPNDYRLWMELGRARAQAGDLEGAERALRRAVELAPHYWEPRWYLGNAVLRQGRDPEAFAEMQRASQSDPALYPQVFGVAQRIYGRDVERIAAAFGHSVTARARLVQHLVGQKLLDDALRLWATFSEAEKQEQRAPGEALARALAESNRFRDVLEVARDMLPATEAEELREGRLLNGGFEQNIGRAGESIFGWQVTPLQRTQIAIDARTPHSGARSLRIAFSEYANLDFRNVTQLAVVAPRARYRLEYYVRTEDLNSVSTPFTEVVEAASGHVLAASAPLANGTNDWQLVTIEFTAPPTGAVRVRISRAVCADAACPILGKVWYDDFDLQKIGGDGASAPGEGGAGRGAAPRGHGDGRR